MTPEDKAIKALAKNLAIFVAAKAAILYYIRWSSKKYWIPNKKAEK